MLRPAGRQASAFRGGRLRRADHQRLVAGAGRPFSSLVAKSSSPAAPQMSSAICTKCRKRNDWRSDGRGNRRYWTRIPPPIGPRQLEIISNSAGKSLLRDDLSRSHPMPYIPSPVNGRKQARGKNRFGRKNGSGHRRRRFYRFASLRPTARTMGTKLSAWTISPPAAVANIRHLQKNAKFQLIEHDISQPLHAGGGADLQSRLPGLADPLPA